MSTNLLSVIVKDPKNQIFKGEVTSITSTNKKGKFDILPFHSNFISLIKDFVVLREQNKKEITIPLQSGIMRVHEDQVNILIGV